MENDTLTLCQRFRDLYGTLHSLDHCETTPQQRKDAARLATEELARVTRSAIKAILKLAAE